MGKIESLQDFARLLLDIGKSDRDNLLAVAGNTGEGKSCMLWQLMKAYYSLLGLEWQPNNMTWNRKELLLWIDGKPESAKDKDGLKEGQLPEYSGIMTDELFALFYKRNWFQDTQIDSLATLNMCRDRHLLVAGAVPCFWDLDTGFLNRVRYYIYVKERGVAWVFSQENNPFVSDPWNKNQNKVFFRQNQGRPYSLSNFVCELHFLDWTPEEKVLYYGVRNEKRVKAIEAMQKERHDKYRSLRNQRDAAFRWLWHDLTLVWEQKAMRPLLLKAGLRKLTWTLASEKLDLSIPALQDIYDKED